MVLIFISCQTKTQKIKTNLTVLEKDKKNCIQPINNFKIKPEIYIVNAETASEIKLPTGSKIKFPKNAFTDKKGNRIKGKVTIKWNEYHTLTDILLSGIPMKYDSAGVEKDLISGGMFTISAKQKDQEIQLAEGKTAQIDIASINDTPCMNFYELDKKNGDWNYETTKKATPIEQKDSVKPEESYTIIDVSVNTDQFPELTNKSIVGWKTTQILTTKEKKILNRNDNKCSLTSSEKTNNYTLNVISKNNLITSVSVTPYLFEDAMKKTSKLNQDIQSDYIKLLAYQNKMEKRQNLRSICIKGFGTFNWDICHQANRQQIVASLNLPRKIDFNYVSLFLITPQDNCIVKYGLNDLKNFSFNPSLKNCIIAILPDNSIYVSEEEDFKKINKSSKSYEFELVNSNIKLNEGGDLTNCLKDLF